MSKLRAVGSRPWTKLSLILGGSAAGVSYLYHASDGATASTTLNPSTFTPFTLSVKEPVSSTAAIFRLHNPQGGVKDDDALANVKSRGVWSIQIKQPQLQIARSYTPLPSHEVHEEDAASGTTSGDTDIYMLIRRERGGEVSNYLHDLAPESDIELRGPFLEYELASSIKRIIFLAGGTGIAPALQLAHLIEDRPDVHMTILWANRRREDCEGGHSLRLRSSGGESGISHILQTLRGSNIPRTKPTNTDERTSGVTESRHGPVVRLIKHLEDRSSGRLSAEYFVDEEEKLVTPAIVKATALQFDRLSTGGQVSDGDSIILVSGPPGFMDYWAGRKIWDSEGEKQGPLMGQLGQMGLRGWSVWKL